jgi:choline dehydrogenase
MTKALQIMENTTAFRNMNTVYLENSPAACSTFVPRSVEYWKCYITQRAFSWNHISGTTKMGLITDPLAVVDSRFVKRLKKIKRLKIAFGSCRLNFVLNSRLRVRGVTKLKVVDASIMPRNVNANMNAACMLISERAAQEIFSAYP